MLTWSKHNSRQYKRTNLIYFLWIICGEIEFTIFALLSLCYIGLFTGHDSLYDCYLACVLFARAQLGFVIRMLMLQNVL